MNYHRLSNETIFGRGCKCVVCNRLVTGLYIKLRCIEEVTGKQQVCELPRIGIISGLSRVLVGCSHSGVLF